MMTVLPSEDSATDLSSSTARWGRAKFCEGQRSKTLSGGVEVTLDEGND